ncbi:14902_t:CDS:2 [Cetraspora pellucida]|uniref:14902_t:CDS:1 n=1 Tax=Cetraspora pellucida TaxID=1433469 RepID=A0ACA9M3P7_9GLOM|nr:14902_t:CDS:2 [Cetraspora pellucida]
MVPPPIPVDCIEEIVGFLESNICTLHSCLLVNRLWCQIVVPILWRQPFRYKRINPSAKLLQTYWSCMTVDCILSEDMLVLQEFNIKLPDSNQPSMIFNYPSFIKRLNYRDLYDFAGKWYGDPNNLRRKRPFRQDPMKTIAKCLFNLFITRGAKFEYLFWDNGNDLIEKIYEHCEQTFINAASSCHEIETLVVRMCMNDEWSTEKAQRELDTLSQLIDVQKHLKEFIFVEYPGRFWWSPSSRLKNVELSSLGSQVNSLTVVEFYHVDFRFWHPLNSIADLINLETLVFNNCRHQEYVMEPFRFCSFMNLKKLVMKGYEGISFIQSDLLDTLLQHVSKSLMYLSIVMTAETTTTVINAIEKYHLDLLELTIKLDQSHFFALQSCPFYNCPRLNKLVLSSWGYVEVAANAILPQLGKSLPPSVEHLEILAPWMFNLRALESFLDNCKAPLKYFDIRYCREVSDQHINLIWKRLYHNLENLIISEKDPPSSDMDVDEQSNSNGPQDKNYELDSENTNSGFMSSDTENESRNYQTDQVSNEDMPLHEIVTRTKISLTVEETYDNRIDILRYRWE